MIGLLKEHWHKVLAAIMVPVIIAAITIYANKREAKEVRQEEKLVESGRKDMAMETQQEVLKNVEKAAEAERNPDPDALVRVRAQNDRCTRDPASCQ